MGESVLRGSGRAPEGFSLYQALEACAPYLHHFGGHASAVGCGVSREGLTSFRQAFLEVAAGFQVTSVSETTGADPLADDYLPLAEATMETVDFVSQFEPFGATNPPLVFYIGPVEIKKITVLKSGKHVRLTVMEGTDTAELIWFQAPTDALRWREGAICGLTVLLQSNYWQGTRRIQLVVQDGWLLHEPYQRVDFTPIYRQLRRQGEISVQTCEQLANQPGRTEIDMMMAVFVELGFAEFAGSAYHVIDEAVPRDLRDSITYQLHLRERHIWRIGEAK